MAGILPDFWPLGFQHFAPVSSTAADRPGHHDEQLLLQESCVRSWAEN
jgi:hypothetical protein